MNNNNSDSNSNNKNCKEVITSDEYGDFLIRYNEEEVPSIIEKYNPVCYNIIDGEYIILHYHLEREKFLEYFLLTPGLYGPYGKESLDEAGILKFHTQSYVQLLGNDVILGFIDSGIEYTHPVFVYEDNTTKILSIWDQTIQDGRSPEEFGYGTVYTEEMINEALNSEDPYSVVPSRDETGHGTFLAGVAAGRKVEDYVGAAPDADIIMVKLKQAKKYLRDFYQINDDAIAYESIDMMKGIDYLVNEAKIRNKPIVICVGLGSNVGAHNGTQFIEMYIDEIGKKEGVVVVIAAGNEANLAHHFEKKYDEDNEYEDVELNVGNEEKGVNIQVWAMPTDVYSIGVISPGGEFTNYLIRRSIVEQETKLVLEETTIYISVLLTEERTSSQVILIRLEKPTPGIWIIRVYGIIIINGRYDMWIDRKDWIDKNTRFLSPNPFTTVTTPSTGHLSITVGAYNTATKSEAIFSGRGLTRDMRIKPNVAAPGVNVLGPTLGGGFGTRSGTSVAAAIVAGGIALFLEWAIVLGNMPGVNSIIVQKTIERGAIRKKDIIYPNREVGYGLFNLKNTFDIIKKTMGN